MKADHPQFTTAYYVNRLISAYPVGTEFDLDEVCRTLPVEAIPINRPAAGAYLLGLVKSNVLRRNGAKRGHHATYTVLTAIPQLRERKRPERDQPAPIHQPADLPSLAAQLRDAVLATLTIEDLLAEIHRRYTESVK